MVAVVTTDNRKYLGYTVGDHGWADYCGFFQVSSHHSLLGRQVDAAVLLDNYTEEIMGALLPSLLQGYIIEDLRENIGERIGEI